MPYVFHTLQQWCKILGCLHQDADGNGECLVRILLGVPCLQAEVARVILEIIPHQARENVDLEQPLQKRLLGQLRW